MRKVASTRTTLTFGVAARPGRSIARTVRRQTPKARQRLMPSPLKAQGTCPFPSRLMLARPRIGETEGGRRRDLWPLRQSKGSVRQSSLACLLHAPSRGFRSFRRPSGNMHLPQELGEVRALKAQLVRGFGLVPSSPAQGVFNYLLFIGFHHVMVVPGRYISLGYMLSCFGHGGKREMLRFNRFVGAEDHGTGQHVLQLPDIARPRILLQQSQCAVTQ